MGHCVVFLGKKLYSHSASLNPNVYIRTREFIAGGGGVTLRWTRNTPSRPRYRIWAVKT